MENAGYLSFLRAYNRVYKSISKPAGLEQLSQYEKNFCRRPGATRRILCLVITGFERGRIGDWKIRRRRQAKLRCRAGREAGRKRNDQDSAGKIRQ